VQLGAHTKSAKNDLRRCVAESFEQVSKRSGDKVSSDVLEPCEAQFSNLEEALVMDGKSKEVAELSISKTKANLSSGIDARLMAK